jgi:hypothetical protein
MVEKEGKGEIKMTTIERRKAIELQEDNKKKLAEEMAKIEEAYPQIKSESEEKNLTLEKEENAEQVSK